ncbi:helix-turn-helix transcriptional regulator [Microbacterium sp.]|uniref:helix-turn-helix transcriptional regulator n=1 Tax=Microbacterium sp. TaxID=51671 RepID=UPI003F6F9D65
MKYFTAVVEVSKRGNMSGDEVDAIMDRLAGHPVSLSVTPRGYQAARITLPADNIAQAATGALLAVTHGFGIGLDGAVSIELADEDEMGRRDGAQHVPELVGPVEAAALIGVSPQRVRQMIDEGKIAAHRVGERSIVLVRSEVLAAAASKQDGIPGLGSVLRELGLEARDVLATPLHTRAPEYRWSSAGQEFESEEPPPPDAEDPRRRIVDRYRFRVPGEHDGGVVEVENGTVVTTFDRSRFGDWLPFP